MKLANKILLFVNETIGIIFAAALMFSILAIIAPFVASWQLIGWLDRRNEDLKGNS